MLVLLTSLLLFAATIVVQKFVLLAGVPINAFLALRMLAPSIFLTGIEFYQGQHRNLKLLLKPIFITLACITTLIPLFLKNLAHQKMSSAKFALIGSTDPFLTCALAYIFLGQTVSKRQYLGILTAMFGVFILTNHKIAFEPTQKIFLHFSWPELCALGAVIFGRLGWMANQHLLKNNIFSERQANIMFMSFPGLLAATLATATGQSSQIIQMTTPQVWLAIIGSITLNTLACLLMTRALQKFSSITISLAGTNIIPLTVALASAPIHGEPLSKHLFTSGVFIFFGLLIFNFKAKTFAKIFKQDEPEIE